MPGWDYGSGWSLWWLMPLAMMAIFAGFVFSRWRRYCLPGSHGCGKGRAGASATKPLQAGAVASPDRAAAATRLHERDALNPLPSVHPLHWPPVAMLALATLGFAIAFYVAQASYLGRLLWAPAPIFEGSNIVARSPYARIAGVPLSFLGVIFYAHMLGLAAFLAYDPRARGLRVAALVYTGIGVAYGLFAMTVQAVFIRAVCLYCAVSAIVTLALLCAALWHFRASGRRAVSGAG